MSTSASASASADDVRSDDYQVPNTQEMSLIGLMERAAVRRQEDGLPGFLFESSQASQRSPSRTNSPTNVRSVIQAALSILDDEDL